MFLHTFTFMSPDSRTLLTWECPSYLHSQVVHPISDVEMSLQYQKPAWSLTQWMGTYKHWHADCTGYTKKLVTGQYNCSNDHTQTNYCKQRIQSTTRRTATKTKQNLEIENRHIIRNKYTKIKRMPTYVQSCQSCWQRVCVSFHAFAAARYRCSHTQPARADRLGEPTV